MGVTIPPESHSQPASSREEDPHESVTIAPPAPNCEEMLRQATPIPSLENSSDQHFRAAVDAGSRAGSSLSELSKIVAELSGGLSGAKQANEQLVYELTTLRAMLGSANEQQLALRHRNALLEQEVMAVQSAADREREFLTEQHDDFLKALLEEHEEALAARDSRDSQDDTRRMSPDMGDLAQKLVQAESARSTAENECARAREALGKLQAQRDEAQARAEKRERERDELRAEASQLRARLGTHRSMSTTPPPPVVSSRPPSFRPPQALQLDASELDSTLHTRSSSPRLPSVKPRLTQPPAELAGAVYTPRSLTPPLPPVSASAAASAAAPSSGTTPSSAPTAEPFPRESTRPGVGGPKPSDPPPPPSFGPPPSGWTPVPPAPEPEPSKAPAARPAVISAASMPPGMPSLRPLKQKPDPTTRPLIDYSLGGDGVLSETLEGARLSSKPPRK